MNVTLTDVAKHQSLPADDFLVFAEKNIHSGYGLYRDNGKLWTSTLFVDKLVDDYRIACPYCRSTATTEVPSLLEELDESGFHKHGPMHRHCLDCGTEWL